jgi:AcrR family transcriptional regulator
MATTSEQTEPRIPLSRDRILGAALEFADEHGIEALSMRKLGQLLGFEAMSLYNHVKNKEDLLDGMLELVLAETEPPAADGPWDEAIRESAVSVHDALRRHPWAANRLMTFAGALHPRMVYMNGLLGRLREAGFSADTTYHAYHVLDGHIFGFSIWENAHSNFDPQQAKAFAERLDDFLPKAEFPHLHEHGVQHLSEGPHRHVSAFEYGLDLILEGLRRVHAAETST